MISPDQIGAMQIAQTALRPTVVEFVELATSAENLELAIEEIAVAAPSPLVGRTLVDANLRQRFGVIVVGIERIDGRMEFDAAPDFEIRSRDKLVVHGRPDSLKKLEVEAAGS